MGKKRQRSGAAARFMRPEHVAPAPELYAADHERYHGQNGALQGEMAELAVVLLGLQDGAHSLVADLGCGSGLSAAALTARSNVGAWLGTDITPEMVRLAARLPGAAGRLAISDFGQGLPLRRDCLDGAISISAVQWLCCAAQPGPSIHRFFSALAASLRPGARAALQVYPEDERQAQQLVEGARRCGLDAGFFVAFPHSHSAKKFYILARVPPGSTNPRTGRSGVALDLHCCNLAWPKPASCMLPWLDRLPLRQLSADAAERAQQAAARTRQEHVGTGKRLVCLLRRAVVVCGAACSGGSGSTDADAGASGGPPGDAERHVVPSSSGSDGGSGNGPVVHAELEAQHSGLLPCGGSIFVQLTAAAQLLQDFQGDVNGGGSLGEVGISGDPAGSTARAGSAAAATPAAAGAAAAVESDLGHLIPGAEAVCMQLLGAGGPSPGAAGANQHASSSDGAAGRRHVLGASAKLASPDDAALHSRQQPGQRFHAPPEGAAEGGGSVASALRFMQLEPLEGPFPPQQQQQQAVQVQQQQCGQQQCQCAQAPAQGLQLSAAVLHVKKMAQHLVLRLSCRRAGACDWCSGSGAGLQAAGASNGGAGSAGVCAACAARRVQALCAELGGCVVGLDAHLFLHRTDATWVLFLPGLQDMDRGLLAASIARLVAAPAAHG